MASVGSSTLMAQARGMMRTYASGLAMRLRLDSADGEVEPEEVTIRGTGYPFDETDEIELLIADVDFNWPLGWPPAPAVPNAPPTGDPSDPGDPVPPPESPNPPTPWEVDCETLLTDISEQEKHIELLEYIASLNEKKSGPRWDKAQELLRDQRRHLRELKRVARKRGCEEASATRVNSGV